MQSVIDSSGMLLFANAWEKKSYDKKPKQGSWWKEQTGLRSNRNEPSGSVVFAQKSCECLLTQHLPSLPRFIHRDGGSEDPLSSLATRILTTPSCLLMEILGPKHDQPNMEYEVKFAHTIFECFRQILGTANNRWGTILLFIPLHCFMSLRCGKEHTAKGGKKNNSHPVVNVNIMFEQNILTCYWLVNENIIQILWQTVIAFLTLNMMYYICICMHINIIKKYIYIFYSLDAGQQHKCWCKEKQSLNKA